MGLATLDVEFILGKASSGQRDTIGVFTGFLDVIRWIILARIVER